MMTTKTLTTRTLVYVDKDGEKKEVLMDLLLRADADGDVRAGLRFGPPINWERFHPHDDVLHQIIYILAMWWMRLFLSGMSLANNIRWVDSSGDESFNCGLPALRKRPPDWTPPEIPPSEDNPGDLAVLSSSTLPYLDESGVEQEIPLFVFMPKPAENGRWKCGFAFGPRDTAKVRYGVGDDFIQSFLDAAAMIRLVHEGEIVPKGWKSQEREACERLPYKKGKGYFLDHDDA